MSDLEKYHDQVVGQQVVNFQIPPEPGRVGTSNLLAGIFRRWYIVLLILFVMCAAGLPAIWFLIDPVYEVTGAVTIAPIMADILTDVPDSGEISNYSSFMNTQAEMITSSRVVRRVADDLADRNLPFLEDEPTDPISKLKRKIDGTQDKRTPEEILKQAITNGVIVAAADRLSELIRITVLHPDREQARQIVDAFINAYTAVEVSASVEDEDKKLTILENERKLLAEKMESQRQAIYRLGQEYGTVALGSRTDMMLQRVGSLLSTLTEVEAERIKLEAQVQLLELTKTQPIAPGELLSMRQSYINEDPAVVAFTANITELEQELVVAKQTLSPTNPEIELKAELIQTLKAHLEERRQEASKAFDDLVEKEAAEAGTKQLVAKRSELEQTRQYEKGLRETLSKEDTETIDLGRTQLTIQELQDGLLLAKEMYDTVQRRIQDLEMQRKRPARISVAYYADIARVLDKRVKYSAALVFTALVCGMGLAHLRDKADQSLRTPDDVAKRIGIRIIGTTTSLHTVKPALLPERIIGDYQTIRANLGLLGGEGIPKKLVITSPGMKEGKTTFAINLATSIAESGKRVLLVDGDLRKPDVARLLNLPKGARGLQDVLSGVEFEDVVYSIASSGLDVLAADYHNAADAYELLALPSTAHRIDTISKKYDHVIIDTPPALGFPDALLWAKVGDAVILTSFAGHTTMPDLKEATDRLAQINVRVLGTVLSSVQAEHSYYRHGHSYYAQSAQSRESARRSRRKLMFSVDGGVDHSSGLETSVAERSADNYSYTQSPESRKDTGRKRKKPRLSVEDGADKTDDPETPRTS